MSEEPEPPKEPGNEPQPGPEPQEQEEDKPITAREFKENINLVMNEVLAKVDETVSKKINANTAEFSRVLSEHAEAINALAKRQEPQAVSSSTSKTNQEKLDTVLALLDHPIVKAKLGLEEPNPATQKLQSLGETVALGIQRRSIKELEKIAIKQFKKGDLFADEVTDIVQDTVVQHGI